MSRRTAKRQRFYHWQRMSRDGPPSCRLTVAQLIAARNMLAANVDADRKHVRFGRDPEYDHVMSQIALKLSRVAL